MDKDFWLNRWTQGETGWHQNEVEPSLKNWASSMKPCRILVPLCGKSLDLAWLQNQGFDVVGAELSELACEDFFKENNLQYKKNREGHFTVFRGDRITLFNGDFFKLTPEILGNVNAVYDRAALIALPPEMRTSYTSQLKNLIQSSVSKGQFKMLQIILTRAPHDLTGPPFSILTSELEKHYSQTLKMNLVSEEPVEARGPEGSKTHELVFNLESP